MDTKNSRNIKKLLYIVGKRCHYEVARGRGSTGRTRKVSVRVIGRMTTTKSRALHVGHLVIFKVGDVTLDYMTSRWGTHSDPRRDLAFTALTTQK